MKNDTTTTVACPTDSGQDLLSEVIRGGQGARDLLAQAVEAEAEQWIQDHDIGRRM